MSSELDHPDPVSATRGGHPLLCYVLSKCRAKRRGWVEFLVLCVRACTSGVSPGKFRKTLLNETRCQIPFQNSRRLACLVWL